MEFTFNESVALVDAYTEKMLQHINGPLHYQLQTALYILANNQPSEEQLEDAYEEGLREGRSQRNEVSYEDGYDKGYDDAHKEMKRAQ